jgi:hypothetical protein
MLRWLQALLLWNEHTSQLDKRLLSKDPRSVLALAVTAHGKPYRVPLHAAGPIFIVHPEVIRVGFFIGYFIGFFFGNFLGLWIPYSGPQELWDYGYLIYNPWTSWDFFFGKNFGVRTVVVNSTGYIIHIMLHVLP